MRNEIRSSPMSNVMQFAADAKDASRRLAVLSASVKDEALENIALRLTENKERIFEANRKDLQQAQIDNLEKTLFKRLKYDETKLSDSVAGIRSLRSLSDPLGKTLMHTTLDDGLELYRVTVPIGVIGVIFESRPDALVQIASLCLKSGNAVLLKGGREAINTNKVLSEIIYNAGIEKGLPEGWLSLLTSREDVGAMLTMDKFIDLIIPRGSNAFVQYIMQNTNITVMGHADGVCHTYIDKDADPEMAVKVAIDAKTQYVSVCNTTETILVHKDLLDSFVPVLMDALKEKGVTVYGDDILSDKYGLEKVTEWHHEYLDYKVSMKVVADVYEAVDHINRYGSGHSDCIITGNRETAEIFMNGVDSGSVMWNCSTRFADGFRYGFGAEVGVSTSKLHARGPVGLEGLVTYKYKLMGSGDIVADYADKTKTFKHIRREV